LLVELTCTTSVQYCWSFLCVWCLCYFFLNISLLFCNIESVCVVNVFLVHLVCYKNIKYHNLLFWDRAQHPQFIYIWEWLMLVNPLWINAIRNHLKLGSISYISTFPNFYYHGNKRPSGVNVNAVIKLQDFSVLSLVELWPNFVLKNNQMVTTSTRVGLTQMLMTMLNCLTP